MSRYQCTHYHAGFRMQVKSFFKQEMLNSAFFKLLNCRDFLPFIVLCDARLKIVVFWTVGRTKQAI